MGLYEIVAHACICFVIDAHNMGLVTVQNDMLQYAYLVMVKTDHAILTIFGPCVSFVDPSVARMLEQI